MALPLLLSSSTTTQTPWQIWLTLGQWSKGHSLIQQLRLWAFGFSPRGRL